MGLRTKTALVIALTTALAATVIGFLVHHRTAENQQQNARTAVDDLLVEALHDVASGTGGSALVDPPELPAALRRAVTERPVRATYLSAPGGTDGPVMWAAARQGTRSSPSAAPTPRRPGRWPTSTGCCWAPGWPPRCWAACWAAGRRPSSGAGSGRPPRRRGRSPTVTSPPGSGGPARTRSGSWAPP
ncbi:hypothetical protein O1L55_30895 [Streptomyces albulus]|nr:hypothetical protein [Streptomyces noursei]